MPKRYSWILAILAFIFISGIPVVASAHSECAQNTVYKAAAYEYQINTEQLNRCGREELLLDLRSAARAVPAKVGFKVIRVRPGSFYRTVGLRSGDAITNLGITPLTSPEDSAALVALFYRAKPNLLVTISIVRRGQPKTLTYYFK
jgi:S1-C subfamily serine protease